MASRRDQLQSYQFLVQRVVSALVLREADPAQTPFRRLAGATMVSVMIGVVALAGVGVFGFIRPGGKQSWRDGNRVVIEKETGTTYYFRKDRNDDSDPGVLHPTANFTSAALLAGSSESVLVSRNSLVDVARGPMLGIEGAPDALPPAKRMAQGPWTLCSAREPDRSDQLVARTVLFVAGGPRRDGTPMDDRTGLLVRDVDSGRSYLVHRGRKHLLGDPAAFSALRGQGRVLVEAGGAWLQALPAGLPLAPLALPGRGTPVRSIPGARVGQVFRTENEAGDPTYYVAVPGGLRQVTQVQADILVAAKVTARAYPGSTPAVRSLAPATAAAAAAVDIRVTGPEQPPATAPELAVPSNTGALCMSFGDAGATPPTVRYDALVEVPEEAAGTPRRTADGTLLADRVVVREGWGALVEAMPSPDAPRGTVTLVTDEGIRYPLGSREVAQRLGYPDRPVALPASLVTRLPEGPGLDTERALRRLR